jgi:hypothetical protein
MRMTTWTWMITASSSAATAAPVIRRTRTAGVVEWTEKDQPKNRQLGRFRTEAEELMKIDATQPTTKAASKEVK